MLSSLFPYPTQEKGLALVWDRRGLFPLFSIRDVRFCVHGLCFELVLWDRRLGRQPHLRTLGVQSGPERNPEMGGSFPCFHRGVPRILRLGYSLSLHLRMNCPQAYGITNTSPLYAHVPMCLQLPLKSMKSPREAPCQKMRQ